MLNSYEALVGLGAEIEKLSSKVLKRCQKVNGIYDQVYEVHENLRGFQSVSVTSASVVDSESEVSPALSDELTKIIAPLIHLNAGVKARLACYGVQLDPLKARGQSLISCQQDLSEMSIGLALKDKLRRNIDYLCESISVYSCR